jgi:hypothetical protein
MKLKPAVKKSFFVAIGAILAMLVLRFTGVDIRPAIEPLADVAVEATADGPAEPAALSADATSTRD